MTSSNNSGSNILGQVTNIEKWDQHFFGDDNDTVFEIILVGPHDLDTLVESSQAHTNPSFIPKAANYLEIQPLLDMGCLTMAKKIAGKPLEAIRADFAIPDLPRADDPATSSPPPTPPQPSATNHLFPPSGLFNPTPTDLRNASRRLLLHAVPLHSGRILPVELADAIASLAYRPLHVARRAEQRAYAANDFLRPPGPEASVAGLYLSTAPLPLPAVGTAVPRRVVFQTRATDQGWADAGGHGTFRDSHTWFEASIVRPVPMPVGEGGVAVEGAKLQEELGGTWETPGEARAALNGRGWDFVENDADDGGGVVWRVSMNMTACGGYRDYRVMWERGVETQVQDERAVGKGRGFLERLESGFVVLLWARGEVSLSVFRHICSGG